MIKIVICTDTQYKDAVGTHIQDPSDYDVAIATLDANSTKRGFPVYVHCRTNSIGYEFRPCALRLLFDMAQDKEIYHFGVVDPK